MCHLSLYIYVYTCTPRYFTYTICMYIYIYIHTSISLYIYTHIYIYVYILYSIHMIYYIYMNTIYICIGYMYESTSGRKAYFYLLKYSTCIRHCFHSVEYSQFQIKKSLFKFLFQLVHV